MISVWGANLLCACVQGAILIAAIWAICLCFPRLSAATRCALWWLSCTKLLISLFWVTPIALPLLPAVAVDDTALPAVSPFIPWYDTIWWAHTLTALFCLWLIGVGIFVVQVVRQFLCIRYMMRRASPITCPDLLAEAQELASQIGLRTMPRLLQSDLAPGPLAVGIWQPAILLPDRDRERLSRTELRSVLAHEFAHLRRYDLWFGIAPLIARTLFFFHPLVWLACNEYEQAQEAACDAEAIRASGLRRDDYGRLLLKLGTVAAPSYRSLALGVKADYRWMLRRLQNLEVVSPMSTSRLSLVLAVGLTALSLIPVRVTAKPNTTKTKAKPIAISVSTMEPRVAVTTDKYVTFKTKLDSPQIESIHFARVSPRIGVSADAPGVKVAVKDQFIAVRLVQADRAKGQKSVPALTTVQVLKDPKIKQFIEKTDRIMLKETLAKVQKDYFQKTQPAKPAKP